MSNSLENCRTCQCECELEKGALRIVKRARDGELDIPGVKQATSVLSQRAGNILHCPATEIARVRREIAEEIGDPKLANLTRSYTILPKSGEIKSDANHKKETYRQYEYGRRHAIRR